jgi:lipopolysaccharide/colanic/teichoic acid biosynthesis glycosyltransferase
MAMVGGDVYVRWFKSACEWLLVLVLLPLALPLMALLALLIACTAGGPVLYWQPRVGRGGRLFNMPKLTTMRPAAEAQTGPVWATPHDPRVTPVGRLLRRTHLDELPQLLLVLTGAMSLIGPRPERPEFVQEFRRHLPDYEQRHAVRPGITGWAQVNLPYDRTLEDVSRKLQYDLHYLHHQRPLLDLTILARTFVVMLRGTGQ